MKGSNNPVPGHPEHLCLHGKQLLQVSSSCLLPRPQSLVLLEGERLEALEHFFGGADRALEGGDGAVGHTKTRGQ